MGNKLFYGGIFFSLLVHGIIIGRLSFQRIQMATQSFKPLEVTYPPVVPQEQKVSEPPVVKELELVKKKERINPDVKVLVKSQDIFSSVGHNIRDISKLERNFKLNQKQTPVITPLEKGRMVSIPVFKAEKITNPKYLSYNQSIRQKIKQRAYAFANHAEFDSGNVYLTFIISSDGGLQRIKIIEGKTSASDYLRNAGLRSIQESSPFPPFPEDLKYPELTFNVVISFEVKE